VLKLLLSRAGLYPEARVTLERSREVNLARWGQPLTDLALGLAPLFPTIMHGLSCSVALMAPSVFLDRSWALSPLVLVFSVVTAYLLTSAVTLVVHGNGTNSSPVAVERILAHGLVPRRALMGIPAEQALSIASSAPGAFDRFSGKRLYLRARRTFDPSRLDERTREAYDVLAPGFEGTAGELLETAKSL
jgi:hypothetical protein